MTPAQLNEFLNRHAMSAGQLATVIGVTPMAINHWLFGRRSVSLTVARLLRTFDKYPGLIKEFGV